MNAHTPAERIQQLYHLRRAIDAEISELKRRIRAAEARPRRSEALCGTESGYSKHRRLGEETCADCKRARREGERDRALRRQVRRDAAGTVPYRQDDQIPVQRKAS